jgi:hypothetical protein
MKKTDTDTLVEELYKDTIKLLRERIKDKTATAADIKTIRELVRDHGVQLEIISPNSDLGDIDESLGELLPFQVAK